MPLALATVKWPPCPVSPFRGLSAMAGIGEYGPAQL